MARTRPMLVLACLPLLSLMGPLDAHAQLLSPGRLASPHGELNGVRKCTSCHDLSKAGARNEKCLACHGPLSDRVREGRGYHATVADQNCSGCHQEHLGAEADLIQLDTATFDHGEVGFTLVESHARLGCRECHQPDYIVAGDVRAYESENGALARTFLGLGTVCTDCHAADDPHAGQFSDRPCGACHAQVTWKEAEGFDHDATRYRLTGRHRRVECRGCHEPLAGSDGQGTLRFTSLEFASCESCHADEHRGAMGSDCRACHNTAGWQRIARSTVEERFDHSTTRFALSGKHAQLQCDACHGGPRSEEGLRMTIIPETQSNAYPLPVAYDCLSCHTDEHHSAFDDAPGGRVCDNCHDERDWIPPTYDIARHNRDAGFELGGAHTAVACIECHPTPEPGAEAAQFRMPGADCETCHEQDSPHGGQFAGQACRGCHDVRSFAITDFDHDRTRYPLDGAHRDVPCASCHVETRNADGTTSSRYKPLGIECRDCHGDEP